MNWTKITNYTSMGLVTLLAIGAFVLSYVALWDIALSNGLPPQLAWIWPLLIDGSIVVFSIAVIRASLHQERSWWPWSLVGVFTLSTIAFNALHSKHIPIPSDYVSIVVFIVPPIASVLAFETGIAMLRNTATRNSLTQSLADLAQQLAQKTQELADFEARRRAEIQREGQEAKAKWGKEVLDLSREAEHKHIEMVNLEVEIDKATQRLSDITRQIKEKRQELDATQDATLVNVWDLVSHIDKATLDTQTRQAFVALLTNAKVSQKDIAEWAGVTVKTVQRDIAACNGLVKR